MHSREGLCVHKKLLLWFNWLPVTSKAVANDSPLLLEELKVSA